MGSQRNCGRWKVKQVFFYFLFNLKILQHLLITARNYLNRGTRMMQERALMAEPGGMGSGAPWRPWMGTEELSSVIEHESGCR